MTDFDQDTPEGFAAMSTRDLIRLHRGSLHELHERGVINTWNTVTGEWAELIVASALTTFLCAGVGSCGLGGWSAPAVAFL